MYFDSEINAILDNFKGYQPLLKKDTQSQANSF